MQYRRSSLWMSMVLTVHLCAGTIWGQVEAVTMPSKEINLAFTVSGKIIAKHVKLGSIVKTGQALMELDDEIGKANVEITRLTATDLQVQEAKERLAIAEVERQRIETLSVEDVVSDIELKRSQSTVKIGKIQVQQAEMEYKSAKVAHQKAIDEHARYTLLAPIDGTIEKIEKDKGSEVSTGETIDGGQPVLRLVSVQSLLIDAPVPIVQTLDLKKGNRAWVRSRLQGHNQPVAGRIEHIATISDAASGTKLVRVRVPNEKKYLDAGWHVEVHFNEPRTITNAATKARSKP